MCFRPKMYLCAKSMSEIIVQPKESQLSISFGTFLTKYDVTNSTPLCENEQNEREIIQ